MQALDQERLIALLTREGLTPLQARAIARYLEAAAPFTGEGTAVVRAVDELRRQILFELGASQARIERQLDKQDDILNRLRVRDAGWSAELRLLTNRLRRAGILLAALILTLAAVLTALLLR